MNKKVNKKVNKKNKGFSLVELIIVIAIMAILAGVLVPQFVRYLNNSRVSADIETAQSVATALSAQFAQDAVDGTTVVNPAFTEIEATNTALINAIGNVPTSRVDAGAVYYYDVNANGGVIVYISEDADKTAVDADVFELYPTADPDWH